jgi:hypothetical protein
MIFAFSKCHYAYCDGSYTLIEIGYVFFHNDLLHVFFRQFSSSFYRLRVISVFSNCEKGPVAEIGGG